jgi:hypothetical protein
VTDPLEHRQDEILRTDAARLAAERPVDLTGLPAEEAYKLGGLTVSLGKQLAAEWLRSPAALVALLKHHLTDEAGLCGCGERYSSHARHLLEELAKAVEG